MNNTDDRNGEKRASRRVVEVRLHDGRWVLADYDRREGDRHVVWVRYLGCRSLHYADAQSIRELAN